MADKDRFESQGRPAWTAGGADASKDVPVRDPAMLEELAGLVARATKAIDSYGVRIEALRRGCEAAGRPIPGSLHARGRLEGGEGSPPGPEPPAAAASVISYLGRRVPVDAALDRAVRLAVGRFATARSLAAEGALAQATGKVAPALVEGLRRELYFLGHLYETFRHDPVLRNVFPAPKVVERTATDEARARAARTAAATAVERVRALERRLADPIAAVRRTLALHDRTATVASALFDPGARTARLVALALGDRPATVELLRGAVERYERLGAMLAAAGETETIDDPAPLTALAASLEDLARTARQDPLLRPLFPQDPAAAFPAPASSAGRQSGLALS